MRYSEIINETASCGGSSAGGVATAMSGLGAGDPAASIYYTKRKNGKFSSKKKKKEDKMAIIRRPNLLDNQKS